MEFFRRALDASRAAENIPAGDLAMVSEALGDVSELAGSYVDAAGAFANARRLAPAEDQPRLLQKEGLVRVRLGRYSQALTWFTRGMRAARALGEAGTAATIRLEIEMANARMRQGRFLECVSLCARASKEAQKLGDQSSEARAALLTYQCYSELGHPDVEGSGEVALHLAKATGDLIGQANVIGSMGVDRQYQGDWVAAVEMYERARALLEQAGHTVFATTEIANIAEILIDRGLLDEAEPLLRQAIRTWRSARYQLGVAYATMHLGRTVARAQRFDDAEALLSEAAEMFETLGDEGHLVEARARLAELAVFRCDGPSVLPLIDETIQKTVRVGGLPPVEALLHRVKGAALLQLSRPEEAVAALMESIRIADAAKADFEAALSADVLAHVLRARGEPADEFERRAREAFERMSVVWTPLMPALAPAG
jgi:tetratricopeptide (TPR) repeat protein